MLETSRATNRTHKGGIDCLFSGPEMRDGPSDLLQTQILGDDLGAENHANDAESLAYKKETFCNPSNACGIISLAIYDSRCGLCVVEVGGDVLDLETLYA